jgi:hypothetical protein
VLLVLSFFRLPGGDDLLISYNLNSDNQFQDLKPELGQPKQVPLSLSLSLSLSLYRMAHSEA